MEMRETLETAGLPVQPKRRPAKGTLIRPGPQLRYAMVLVGGGVIAQSLIVGTAMIFLRNSIRTITHVYQVDPTVGDTILRAISTALVLSLLVALGAAVAAMLIGIKLSHRIYGPLVPFMRHIDELKAGNFTSRIRLRKDDELFELRDGLNDLAITLEDRFKTP